MIEDCVTRMPRSPSLVANVAAAAASEPLDVSRYVVSGRRDAHQYSWTQMRTFECVR
jgi:hypothetical protein